MIRKRQQQVFGPAGPPSSERLRPSSYYTSRFDLLRRRWGASGFIIGTLLLTMSAAAEARPPPSPQHPHHSSNNAAAAVTPVTAHHTAVDAAATAATVATSSSQTISSQSAPAPLASSKHQETEEAGTGTHLIGAEAKNKKTKKAKTKASTNNKKKKNKPSASTRQSSSTSPSKSRSSSSSSGHANTATMLRVQREWKDLIQAGVAFDWNKGQPVSVTRHEKKRHEKKTNNNKPRNIQPQDIWLGPVSLREWWVWHFSFQGVPGSSYAGGVYHGRILLPPNYPAAPPRIHLLTPTGRFVPGTDICLSQASAYHPETWQPSAVRLRTLVEGVRWHMLTNANEIGGVTASLDERRRLARSSREFAMTATRRGTGGTAAAASTVVVDHGRMLREGWIVLEEEDVVDDETRRQEKPVATTEAETARMGKTNKIAATRSDETVEQAESKVEIQQDAFEDGDEGEDDKRSDSNENEPLTAFVSSSATNTKRVIRSQQGFRNDNTHSSSHRKKKTMTKSRRKKHHKTVFGAAAAAGAASGDATVAITQRQQYPNRALSIFGRFLQKHRRWVLLSFCFLLVYLERNIYYWISG